ncbi:hypothetical protein S40288_05316 [Stachybotrys chartarum IBT 40288]|nr:hypothetical protein S40288_05316 [Stachybotrys chartarum IBT 40288]
MSQARIFPPTLQAHHHKSSFTASQDTNTSQTPPYPFHDAQLGGLPTTDVDVPISSVLIPLFLVTFATNMTLHIRNLRRSRMFLPSGFMAAYSMTRVVANATRIAWARNPTNMHVALAAAVFANAGVLLLFLVNIIFSQRLLQAHHPRLGWGTPARVVFQGLFVALGVSLVMVVAGIVYSSYTLDPLVLSRMRSCYFVACTTLSVLSLVPIPIIAFALALPRKNNIDSFGFGLMKTKFQLVAFSSVLLAFGSIFRTIAAYFRRPAEGPAWYHTKAAFYCFIFVVELFVIYTYTFSRVDRLFFVPNGSGKRQSYSQVVFPVQAPASSGSSHSDTDTSGDDTTLGIKDEKAAQT